MWGSLLGLHMREGQGFLNSQCQGFISQISEPVVDFFFPELL